MPDHTSLLSTAEPCRENNSLYKVEGKRMLSDVKDA